MARDKGKASRRSPAMEQFFRAKAQHPDAILFFRLGDFYEMFYDDAVVASQLLDLTLTSRSKDKDGGAIPMAGIPHHAASGYIARLLELGQRVAICEQMADPSKVKGIVPREVVRVVSPGLVLDPDALDARAHNYLVAVVQAPAPAADAAAPLGLAALELTTSELRACALRDAAALIGELVRLDPREILVCLPGGDLQGDIARSLPRAAVRAVTGEQLAAAQADEAWRDLAQGSDVTTIGHEAAQAAALAFAYAQASQPGTPLQVRRVAPYDPAAQLVLDDAAVRNLELVRILSGERKGSLLDLIDATRTAMGARLLRQRLLAPLTDVAAIRRRHDKVQACVEDPAWRRELREALARVHDLERLATRVGMQLATPRDLAAISESLTHAGQIAERIEATATGTAPVFESVRDPVRCTALARKLRGALVEQPPMNLAHGGVFRAGYDAELDSLRALASDSKGFLLELEQREREATGISSLKVRYTRVFGYYIEVTRSHLQSVPSHYRRKQTVAGGERYTTDALDDLQQRILHAEERLVAREAELFEALRGEVAAQEAHLRQLAVWIADLDVHAALAEVAQRLSYVRPEVDTSLKLALGDCRHPVVERHVAAGEFVPNDVCLDVEEARLMVITGPNMAGKSTTMRQVALAVILAQAGSFVPASQARIGIVDRIYTRVGASDNVARGQSTFMLEMQEAASILRGATQRSLVILDEIGRGTSTYDGLAIATAVAEHLHDVVGCRTMFATHYHELCSLADTRDGVVNYNVAAKAYQDQMVFLRRLVPGGVVRSYGIEVAKLAGVPPVVIARARALLRELEHEGPRHGAAGRSPDDQLDLFSSTSVPARSEVETLLAELEVEQMTPLDALVTLARLKDMLDRDA